MIDTITDKKEWDEVLKCVENYDTYHTYEYHHFVKEVNEAPVLLVYNFNNCTIAMALLIRSIEKTSYKDATCVYGYCGPITRNLPDNFDNTRFSRSLKEYFAQHHIVSVFSRLNPFIKNQTKVLHKIGETKTLGNIVSIDTTKDIHLQRLAYHRRLRTYINKSRKLCAIKEAGTEDEIRIFIAQYYETMRRTNAHEKYFFDEAYFFSLMNSTDFKCTMLLVLEKQSAIIVGGAMFLHKNGIVHYHLSCANNRGLELNAIKLVIDEMRIRATEKEYDHYNLGGGLGSKEDSLFYFKSGFSKNYTAFKIWKYIANQQVYDDLTQKRNTLNKRVPNDHNGYFPAYRA